MPPSMPRSVGRSSAAACGTALRTTIEPAEQGLTATAATLMPDCKDVKGRADVESLSQASNVRGRKVP